MQHFVRRIHRRPCSTKRPMLQRRQSSQSSGGGGGEDSVGTQFLLMMLQSAPELGKQQMVSLATALVYCVSLAGVFIYQQPEDGNKFSGSGFNF